MIKKSLLLSIATLGIGMCVVTVHPHAASIEQMKANVNADTGAIFSEELGRDMTKSEAGLYFETVSQEQHKLGLSTSQVTPEIDKAARQVVAENAKKPVHNTKTKLNFKPDNLLLGTSIPTEAKTLTGSTYKSDPFSGSGWRYSGYYFNFKDYAANPSFGVRVNGDSFNFITRRNTAKVASYAVNPDGKFHYYPSTNSGNLNGYFATLDPVSGSYYEIN